MSQTTTEGSHYEQLVARQLDQFKEIEVMHALPDIFHYWALKYLAPRAASVTGTSNIVPFYAHYFRKALRESDSIFLISMGAGDCSIEIEIVRDLMSTNEKFFFVCLELSPVLIKKARQKIDAEGLGDIMTVTRTDINSWTPKYSFAGVMANHALHHFLDLEQLFSLIKDNLAPHGRFLTCDIIGRNGHMRWPEALGLLRKIWERIPRKYKFHHQLGRYDDYFPNFDCSVEGFEGIRAQDILPLLVKMFSFEVFCGYGNLFDPIIDRGYGPNYDVNNKQDTDFIDYLHFVNEKLTVDGILKPTALMAVMVNEPVANPSVYKYLTPQFALRDPEASAPEYDPAPFLEGIPYQLTPEDNPLIANAVPNCPLNTKLIFSSTLPAGGDITGRPYLAYGWGEPEDSFTWSFMEDAALLFPLEERIDGDLLFTLHILPYPSPLFPQASIDVFINEIRVETLQYDNATAGSGRTAVILLPDALIRDKDVIMITFGFPNRRQPQFESGSDLRSLGMAWATLSPGQPSKPVTDFPHRSN